MGLDWSSVATGVVVGLILAVLIGSFRWYLGRRERKARGAEARSEARIPLRAGVQQVTQELRANAEVAKRFEAGHRAPAERKALSVLQWRNFQEQIAGLKAEAPELWRELVGTCAELDLARHGVANPPRSDDLLRLADRLDKAASSA